MKKRGANTQRKPSNHQWPALARPDCLEFPVSLCDQVRHLLVKHFDRFLRSFNGGSESAAVALPATDAVHLGCSTAALGLNLVTQSAFLLDWQGLHDKFHTTSFARSVLAVAVLAEVSPLPITAEESVLVEEAHVWMYVTVGLPDPSRLAH